MSLNLKTSLKIIFTVLLVGFIFNRVGIDRFSRTLQTINLQLFLIAFICFPLVIWVGGQKWHRMIRHEATNITLKDALISFLGGASLGLLTPGRVGEFGRIAFIRDGRAGVLAGIALIDKFVDLEVTLILAIGGVFVLFGSFPALLLAASTLIGVFFIFYTGFFLSLIEKVLHFLPFKDKLRGMLGGMMGIPASSLVFALFLRLVASFIDIFQFYLLINSFAGIGLWQVACVYPIIILSNILPLTIGGIGVREGISIITLSMFGISPEAAANASFLLFVINTLIPGLIGALYLPKLELNKSRA